MRTVATVLVAATVLLAGCTLFASDVGIPDHIVVHASDAFWIDGWGYDAANVTEAEGSMTIDVVASAGTGTATGSITVDDTTTTFDFIEFHGADGKPSHDNGINQDFQEHGASGNGHDLIPELHAVTSGWGTVNVSVDGQPIVNPLTGEWPIPAHFMVTDTGIRDDASREVRVENGSLYRPAWAGNGTNTPGDHEVHVVIDSGEPEVGDPGAIESGTLTPVQPSASVGFQVGYVTTTIEAEVNVQSTAGNPSPGEVNVSLSGPNRTYKQATIGGPQGANNVSWTLEGVEEPGDFEINMTTESSASWQASVQLDPPERLFLHFLYEEATWQEGG